jgi:hypothetical protein
MAFAWQFLVADTADWTGSCQSSRQVSPIRQVFAGSALLLGKEEGHRFDPEYPRDE